MNLSDRIEALAPERRSAFFDALKRDGDRYDAYPLTPAQTRMWLLSQLRPESPVYNVAYRFDIGGDLDVAALEHALQLVRGRHEALRSVFLPLDGEPRQLVVPAEEDDWRLDVVDLRAASSTDGVDELVQHEARLPFDLARGPLLRATLFRTEHADSVLALLLHHIVCDGWSMRIIYDDLARAYSAHRDGAALELPPLPRYVDVARRQQESLDASAQARLLDYWSRQLSGAPRTVDLHTDRPRPAVLDDEGDEVAFSLPAQIAEQISAAAERLDATPFAVLLAACQALLYRYTRQPDFLLGCPVAGRWARNVEDVVGLFVNTVVLRARIDAGTTFAQLLEQARESSFGALTHEQLPFDTLVQELRVERELSMQPLFQIMVALEDGAAERLELSDVTVRGREITTGSAQFDLTFVFVPDGDRVGGRVEYRTRLFDRSTIDRLIDHLVTLLAAALGDPQRPLVELPLLSDAERDALPAAWGAFPPSSRDSRPVHALIEQVADETPDAPAVRDDQETLSYRELDQRANRIAALLRAHSVRPETPVGVHLPRCSDLVAAFLGILKAGGIYVPLDVQLPAERLRYLLEDTGVAVVLAHAQTAARLQAESTRVVELDVGDPLAAFSAERAPAAVAPDSAAYVIYTSGSTGKPKGVVATHRGLRNLAEAQRELIAVRPEDRVLHFHSAAFDVSISEFVTALCAGAELRIVAADALHPGPDLARTLHEHEITVADLPPAALTTTDPAGLSCLRSLTIGGEPCPADVATSWSRGRDFYNAYGPTETTVTATAAKATAGAPPPIGRPIAGARAYVLDERLELVPVGVPGELYVGGASVARGYLGDPALTARRFLPDPFADDAAERMYRTGDVVRYLEDGSLEFLGRADSQVKLRGHRIELGEVETRLRRCPDVRQAAVALRETAPGRLALVAYVVGEALSVESLRRELGRDLPKYMIPEAFVFMDELPLTAGGKLDVRALPAPSDERPVLETAYAAPRDDAEQAVAAIWRGVLGVAEVGVDDNFFDLGGNSLLLARVRAQLFEELGVEIPILDLFRAPTVALLAASLATNGQQPPAPRRRDRGVGGRRALVLRGNRVRDDQTNGGSDER